ncbi:berberine bridge enzyme-like 22 [Salvia splendens]|uniref:berberine bridge enzyme-like 22 n=1 Tax=Salvia splendens TaxID=180675 RepID=UPI001C26951B|nr:berberine bridge enzyme-like 22 [Salvia splendens]
MASHMLQHLMLYLSILIGFCLAHQEEFVKCMSKQSSSLHTNTSKYVYSLHSQSYFNLLQPLKHNARWKNSVHQRPKFIVTPTNHHQIKAAIICARAHALQIRVLSGGHDFEGLSYRSRHRFVLIDLVNLRSITINMDDETAWIQVGATLGELYYNIAKKSDTHAFPAGVCPSLGAGGHISGGGMGTLVRKYGLAADNILDAKIMNAKGEILDRELMGEDLFWAIRGGGGASFGIILAWRVQLIRVPSLTTVFTIHKDLDDTGIEVVDKWQKIANKLPNDLFIRILLSNNVEKNTQNKPKFERVAFNSLFLGNAKDLLALMNTNFPELGLQEADCEEMS